MNFSILTHPNRWRLLWKWKCSQCVFIRFDEGSRQPAWTRGKGYSKQSKIESSRRFSTITNCWEPKKAEVIHVESSQDAWARVYFVFFFIGGEPFQGHLCFFTVFVSYAIIRYPWAAVGGLPSSYTNYSDKKVVLFFLVVAGFVSVFWSSKMLILIMSFTASESVETTIFWKNEVEWFGYQHESKGKRPFHQLGNKSSDDGITAGDGRPQESDIDSYSIYKNS